MAPQIDIREAAEKLVRYLPKFIKAIDYYGIDGYYRVPYSNDLKELNGRIDFLKSALAMPERNFNRFANEAEASKAFMDWYNEAFGLKGSKNEIDHCDLKHNVNDILHDYIDWLFAPVTEQKGETDGSK